MSGLNVLKTSPRATLLAAWLVLAVFAQFVDQRVADDPPLFGKWTETVDRFGLARRQCISGRQSGTGQTLARKLGNDLSGGLFFPPRQIFGRKQHVFFNVEGSTH